MRIELAPPRRATRAHDSPYGGQLSTGLKPTRFTVGEVYFFILRSHLLRFVDNTLSLSSTVSLTLSGDNIPPAKPLAKIV